MGEIFLLGGSELFLLGGEICLLGGVIFLFFFLRCKMYKFEFELFWFLCDFFFINFILISVLMCEIIEWWFIL